MITVCGGGGGKSGSSPFTRPRRLPPSPFGEGRRRGGGGSPRGGNGNRGPTPLLPLLQDRRPCPGNPVKNPRIAPSGRDGWNTRGGTYGYTRDSSRIFHDGIDIKADVNSPLYAMHSGTVVKIRPSFDPGQYAVDSYGNFITIRSVINGKNIYLKYAHLNRVDVRVGQPISTGSIIGLTGDTGNAQTTYYPDGRVRTEVIPHVHIWAGRSAGGTGINPAPYLTTKFNSNGTVISTSNCN